MASHPKHAVVRPRREAEQAEIDLTLARAELNRANASLRALQIISSDAMMAWLAVCPAPTTESVHRDGIARATAAKLERVARGEPPDEPKPVVIHQTALDMALANRGKSNNVNSRTTRPTPRAIR